MRSRGMARPPPTALTTAEASPERKVSGAVTSRMRSASVRSAMARETCSRLRVGAYRTTSDARTDAAASRRPSITRCGAPARRVSSLRLSGSPSAPFAMTTGPPRVAELRRPVPVPGPRPAGAGAAGRRIAHGDQLAPGRKGGAAAAGQTRRFELGQQMALVDGARHRTEHGTVRAEVAGPGGEETTDTGRAGDAGGDGLGQGHEIPPDRTGEATRTPRNSMKRVVRRQATAAATRATETPASARNQPSVPFVPLPMACARAMGQSA